MTNNGAWSIYPHTTVQTYYIAVYSPTRSTGSYELGVGLRAIFHVEKAVYVSISNISADRPSKNYGQGVRPVVAQNISFDVLVKDSKGNVIPDFPIGAGFFTVAPGSSGTISNLIVTTGSSGKAHVNMQILPWPCDNEVVGVLSFFRFDMSPYRVYRNYADIRLTMPEGYTCMGTSSLPVYHYGAEFYIG